MKTNKLLSILMMLTLALIATISFLSCSSQDEPEPPIIVPEITLGSSASGISPSDLVFPPEGGTQTVSFNSNVDWTISVSSNISGTQWCKTSASNGKAGNNTVEILVDKSTSVDERSTVVTITAGTLTKKIIVTQKQKNTILLTKQKYEIDNQGGTIDVEAKANISCQVIIPSEFDWISQVSTSRALVTNKYQFKISPSEEYEKREGYIVIKGDNVSETVRIFQSGSSILLLTQNAYTVDADGETISAEIKSNCDYDIIMPNVDWIKQYSGSRAVSSHQVSFVVDKNEGYDSRSAEIIIKDANSDKKESILVTQLQKDAFFTDKDEYSIAANGGQVPVKLSTNVTCSVQIPSSCSWVKVSQSSQSRALRDESIILNVEKNNTVEERSVEINITDSKNLSKAITVKQAAQMLMFEQTTMQLMVDDVKTLVCKKNSAITDGLKWSSSNTSVATVSSNGVITAKTRGNTEITVKTQDGNYSAKCALTVKDILDCLSSSVSNGNWNIGGGTADITWNIHLYNESPTQVKITQTYIQPYDTNFLIHMIGQPQINYSSTIIPAEGSVTLAVRIVEKAQSISMVTPSALFAVSVEFDYQGKKYEKKIPIYIDYSY